MNRVEVQILKNNKKLDELSFCSKNLYNHALYEVRQMFIETSKQKEQGLLKHATYLNYYDTEKLISGIEEYKSIPAQTRQSILKLLDKNWKSFFKSIKDYMKNPSKYKGKPSLPKYLDKQGRFILIYPGQNITIKDGELTIPKTKIKIKTKVNKKDLKELRIVPLGNKTFKIEIVYTKEIIDLRLDKDNAIGIDIGLNNLMAITSNQAYSLCCLINGRQIKSINQYYNKRIGELKSILKIVNNQEKFSKRMNKLILKRKLKIDDYLHKASRKVIELCKQFNIGRIIIGHNKDWKQNIELGRRTNQNFVSIPFNRLIQMIQYKAEEIGIDVLITEESYTSKIDHLAGEEMKHHDVYLGKRVKRGLFKSSTGIILNADINGAIGILKKLNVACKDFFNEVIASRGCVLQPIKLNC